MGMKLITPFKKVACAKAATITSKTYNMRDLFYGITGAQLGYQLTAATGSTSTDADINVQGSYDNKNWDGAIKFKDAVDLHLGANFFGVISLTGPYPFLRFTCIEQNSNPIVDFELLVSYPTSEKVRH